MLNEMIDLPVSTRFEPCPSFVREQPGSPVCGGCGWLDAEHAASAVVRRLPRRVAPALRPRRLAS